MGTAAPTVIAEAPATPPKLAMLPIAVNAVAATIDAGIVVAVLMLVVVIGLVASCVAPVPVPLSLVVAPEVVVVFNAVASVVNIL